MAHFTGSMLCGSPWACPVCGAKIATARAQEVSTAVGTWIAAGNFAAMVSLTLAHGRDDPLETTLGAVVKAFGALTSGRPWQREQAACRVAGWIRAVEVTRGPSGWHPHIHAIVLFEGCPDPVSYARMVGRWQRRWRSAVERAGFAASDAHGVRFDAVMLGEQAGEYICKTMDGRGIGTEVAQGDLKRGRLGSVTPLELLDYFERTADADAADLWAEWERATHGRRRLTWSHGLRRRLLADVERGDVEIAEAEVGGEVVAVIPDEAWWVMCSEKGLLVHVLRAAESGGFLAVVEVLAPYGVTVSRPPPSEGEGSGEEYPEGTSHGW